MNTLANAIPRSRSRSARALRSPSGVSGRSVAGVLVRGSRRSHRAAPGKRREVDSSPYSGIHLMRREPATAGRRLGVAIIGWRSGTAGSSAGWNSRECCCQQTRERGPVGGTRIRNRVEHFRHIAGPHHRRGHPPQRSRCTGRVRPTTESPSSHPSQACVGQYGGRATGAMR